MKKHGLRIFLMLSLISILAASTARAQSASREQTANIPFAFTVGDKTFEAGSYTIALVNPQSDTSALLIKSADGRARKIVITIPLQDSRPQEQARLVFNRYNDHYFLTQVWAQSNATGLELQRSRSERTLLAGAGLERRPERVAIALGARRR